QDLEKQRDATADLAALEKRIADLRKRLAGVAAPADGADLLDELDYQLTAQRAAQVSLLVLGLSVEGGQTDVALAADELNRVSAAPAAAEPELPPPQDQARRGAAARQKLGQSPLQTLRADANAALGAADFNNATARVEADLPQPIRDRARARRVAAANTLDQA